VRRDRTRDVYDADVCVVGAGTAGLVAAAAVAGSGASVLVLERNASPGGYLGGFMRRGFVFDSCVHFVNGCRDGPLGHVLNAIGCRDARFVRPDPMTTLVFPDRRVPVPQGLDEFIALLKDEFPGEARELDRFSGVLRTIFDDAREKFSAQELGARRARTSGGRSAVDRYRAATFTELLDDFFGDESLKAILNAQLCYSGLPASRVSAVWYAIQLATHHLAGSFYPAGGTQAFANRLARTAESAGARFLYRREVDRIIVRSGRVVGVRTSGGESFAARVVIAAANAWAVFLQWLEPGVLPGRLARVVRSWEPAVSSFCVYLGVEGDLAALGLDGSNYLIHDDPDFESQARALRSGRLPGRASVFVSVPTLKDPSLMRKPGHHSVSVITLAPYRIRGGWAAAKQRVADWLVRRAELVIPGLRDMIVARDAATPLTLERYTANRDGSSYGLAPTPEQTFVTRPPNRTPVPGLFLAGHYTFPGMGVQATAQSGLMTARLVGRYLDGPGRYVREGADSTDAGWES